MASLQVMKYGFMSRMSWRSFCGQERQVGPEARAGLPLGLLCGRGGCPGGSCVT